MLARRNLNFWTAAILVAGSYLIVCAKDVLELIQRLKIGGISPGLDVADAISVLAALGAFAGWALVATALRAEIEWSRLRIGAAVVTGAYVATYAASVLDVVDLPAYFADIDAYQLWSSIGSFFLAAAAFAVLPGLADSRRGSRRGLHLQVGLALAAASVAATAVATFELRAYYGSGAGFSGGLRAGALVAAIGQIGLAVAISIFAFEARSPLRQREAMLATAGAAATVASLCIAVGQGLIARDYGVHDAPGWRLFVYWFIAADSFVLAVGLAYVAFGARSAQAATDD